MDFTTYVAERRTRLVRTAVLLGCPRADAEDIVQAALLKCYGSWRRVARADHPDAYVHRVLVATLADARARRWNGELPTETLPDEAQANDADHPDRPARAEVPPLAGARRSRRGGARDRRGDPRRPAARRRPPAGAAAREHRPGAQSRCSKPGASPSR
ncbi:hypothetical protein D0Z08_09455 [Nocardioides immobilis]|uniref:RNA polymerase sigma-70 region 2 domain-containing protein n=1 Tax=Nocardioides immobilis TaxID=2049295 RepID=A0A417Y3X7_9ACTN|nr:sigma factor [Nocardioides immobilis]RHW27368.1 hypothetical protein D0Z08_09455 [Nocardioides immobilis]